MRIDILTLFPDTVGSVLHESIIGRACKKGAVEINCVQIRDYTENKQMQVDDYPYGGGWGCVMMAQPLKSCLDSVMSTADGLRSRVIYMSPQGKTYDQETAKRLVRDYDHLVLVCGHYEGVDERFIEECVDEEISLGDFVLTGGEIAAMAVADSVCRMVPGVLSDAECYTGESHWNGLLEYPQYTRPEVWEGRSVPEVLIQGDHEKVSQWRRMMSIKRTMEKRPDMFEKLVFSEKSDKILMEKINKAGWPAPDRRKNGQQTGKPDGSG
jgi:tRNA (guanine37-N1)-methyltransferase